MAFTDAEKTDARRFCGYPAYGAGAAGQQNWRFYQAYGQLEFRLNNLSASEEAIVRRYLSTLTGLEIGIPNAAANLDTDTAAVWSRNAIVLRVRTALFEQWRRRLCGFLGLPAGPDLAESGLTLVV